MRKRDWVAIGGALTINVFLALNLVLDGAKFATALLQGSETVANYPFRSLSLLATLVTLALCGWVAVLVFKKRFRDAATFQRFCVIATVCQSLLALGQALMPFEGVGGLMAGVRMLVFILLTGIVAVAWFLLWNVAERYDTEAEPYRSIVRDGALPV